MVRLGLLALSVAVVACGSDAPSVSAVAPGLPVIAFTDPEPRSILEVPAPQMPAALKQFYVLTPDTRFLYAVAEVHRLTSGQPADTVKVSWHGDRWFITYRGERVGELPDLPGFEDGNALLNGWATRLISRSSFAATGAPTIPERDSVRALLERVNPAQVSAALRRVDAGWRRSPNLAWLPLAATGLTLLAIQLPKVDRVGDPIVGRALAATALAGAAGSGDSITRLRVLLAEHMGYTREAARLATGLPAGDPARLLALRDRPNLRAAAMGRESTALSRYLYVSAVADLGDGNDFQEALDAVETGPTSGILAAAVTANEFETDALVASTMPPTLAAELAVAGRAGFFTRLGRVLARLIAGRAPRSTAPWADVLRARSDGGKTLADFEDDMRGLEGWFGGPFLNGDLYGTYFRAQLHAAFERACIHYVDGLSTVSGATRFVDAFDDAPRGLWSDVTRWCGGRAAVIAGHGSAGRLLEDLRTVPAMSGPAVSRSLDDIDDLLRYLDKEHLDAARTVFVRLDSRPHEMREASQVATDQLGDVPLVERLDGRVLDLASVDYPDLAVWTAQYRGDARALAAQARDRSLTLEARFKALRDLLEISTDTAATFAAFERLLTEAPDNWDERRRYVEILEHSRRFNDAARVSRAWLAGHDRDRGFDYLFATTALARQYQYMGRLQEAYALLEPLQDSYQAGVLQRSALIALGTGRPELAEDLAKRAVRRYPGSASARVTLAEVVWAQRRYAEGPAVLNDPHSPLTYDDWRWTIAPAFARVFGRRPAVEGESAFDALAQAAVSGSFLDGLPAALADSGYYALALSLKQRLLPPVGGNDRGDDAAAVEFYRYVVAARGVGAGRDWLAARWSSREARRQALSIYRNRQYDLLWELNAVPDDGADGSYYWLVRTLAWVQDPQRDAARGVQLRAFYQKADARFYHMAGRCLLGLEQDATLLLWATTPHRRAEVSYYLGIKALSQRRYNDASDWLRVTVETRSDQDWEVLWAKDLLTRWARTERQLSVAVPRVAAKPPTW
jgi:hypothetical protein